MAIRFLMLGAAALALLPGAALAESRTYTLAPFDSVSVSGGISAVIEIGAAQSVVADAATSAVLDRLDIEVRGNRLEVGFKWNVLDWLFNAGQNKGVVVHVTAPALSGASAGAGADVDVSQMTGTVLSLDSSSGASMSADGVNAERISLSSSSGANLAVAGSCKQMIGDTSSGATLQARDFECTDVDVNASSGGHASVRATKSVDANASSGGGIEIFGNAPEIRSNSSSGGSITFAR